MGGQAHVPKKIILAVFQVVIWNSHFKKRASGIPEIPGNSRESKGIQGNRGNPRLWLEDGAQALDIDHAIVFSS
jgi:hypothetical protein